MEHSQKAGPLGKKISVLTREEERREKEEKAKKGGKMWKKSEGKMHFLEEYFFSSHKTRSLGYANKWILIIIYFITNYKLSLHITVSHINPSYEDISADKWLRR